MKDKWLKLDVFYKSLFFSIIYSSLIFVISLILLIINPYFLYGTIVGVLLLFLSYFIIWILWYKIKSIETFMIKTTPILVPLLRIILFLIVYLILIFVVNDKSKSENWNFLLLPVNTFMFLFVYTLPVLSYFTTGLIDLIITNKNKEIEIEEKNK